MLCAGELNHVRLKLEPEPSLPLLVMAAALSLGTSTPPQSLRVPRAMEFYCWLVVALLRFELVRYRTYGTVPTLFTVCVALSGLLGF